MFYTVELTIIMNDGEKFYTAEKFDIGTDNILLNTKEYQKLMNEHEFFRLKNRRDYN